MGFGAALVTADVRRSLEASLNPAGISQRVDLICAALDEASKSRRLLVVGSARLPQKVVHAVQVAGGEVAALVEFAPQLWGRTSAGLTVCPLNEALHKSGPDPLAVVGIWSPNHIYDETRSWLEAAGVRHILPVNAAFWAYAHLMDPWYQFGHPGYYGAHVKDILAVFDHLADAESKRQFAGILRYRVTLESDYIPRPSINRIYFDPSIARLPNDAVIADVGAFSGDTLNVFLYWRGTEFSRFVAFEPDPLNFKQLQAFRAGLPPVLQDRIDTVQAAVGSAPCKLRFAATGSPGSKAFDAGEVEVDCLTLDVFFDNRRLDYIKIDVEGYEPEVLAGAWNTIYRERPVIGLSVYHSPGDVFALPLQLINRLPDYSFFFRAHDYDGIDFIFYAVPNEKSGASAK